MYMFYTQNRSNHPTKLFTSLKYRLEFVHIYLPNLISFFFVTKLNYCSIQNGLNMIGFMCNRMLMICINMAYVQEYIISVSFRLSVCTLRFAGTPAWASWALGSFELCD